MWSENELWTWCVQCLLSWSWRSDSLPSSVFHRVGTLSTSIVLPCCVSCPSTRPSPWPRAALLQTLTFNSDNQGSDLSPAGSLNSSVTQTCMCEHDRLPSHLHRVNKPELRDEKLQSHLPAAVSVVQLRACKYKSVHRLTTPRGFADRFSKPACRRRERAAAVASSPGAREASPKTKRDKDCRLFWYQRRRLFL